MVDVCRPFLDEGRIQPFAVDGVDHLSWMNEGIPLPDHPKRHNQYDRDIVEEIVPYRWGRCGNGGITAHGYSYGVYHLVNSFFRHPDIFDTKIALSGPFHARYCIGDYMDDNVYYNSPIAFLPILNDPRYPKGSRRGRIVICVGRGYWVDVFPADTLELKRILEEKQIPAWIDIWGHDMAHDWPWWKKMMPYFLKELGF